MRPRDPRRLLERHRRARARVTLVREPQSHGAEETGATGSRQVAEVTLPKEELEKLWPPSTSRAWRAPTGASCPASRWG